MNMYNDENQDRYLLYIVFSLFLFTIDRLTKHCAMLYGAMFLNDTYRLFCIPPMQNVGTAFSWFSLANKYVFYSFMAVTVLMLYLLVRQLYQKYKLALSIYGECFVLVGGIANLYDRLVYGYVVDFIFLQLPIINYFAVYNLADAFIVFGILYIFWDTCFNKNNT